MIRDNFHTCTLIFCLFHSAHSCCFLVRFISLCTLFFSVVCAAAVICFGCACQPCCVVLWELEPASIVSISSSLSLPRPPSHHSLKSPGNPSPFPRVGIDSVLPLPGAGRQYRRELLCVESLLLAGPLRIPLGQAHLLEAPGALACPATLGWLYFGLCCQTSLLSRALSF